jgi:hypothetical protein
VHNRANKKHAEMAYAEAQRQGVDPDALEARLQARGINTATLTMTDIPRIQPIVEEEIAENEGGAKLNKRRLSRAVH